MGRFEINSRKPSTFEVAVIRVVSQTLAFYFAWTFSRMALFTETPNSELDVIDGGFRTKPALGLQGLGYLSVAQRGWKLEHAPIPCLDSVFESPSFFWGRMMLRIRPNAAFSSGLAAS
jgi:hypothetical protein